MDASRTRFRSSAGNFFSQSGLRDDAEHRPAVQAEAPAGDDVKLEIPESHRDLILDSRNVKIHFYGTKGYVEESSREHAGHSAFVLEDEGFRLLCDFGQNRKGMLDEDPPDAIFVSHAHPDHGWGLWEGTRRARSTRRRSRTSSCRSCRCSNRVVLARGARSRSARSG